MACTPDRTKGDLTGEPPPTPVMESPQPPERRKDGAGRRTSPFDEDHEQAEGAGAAEAAQPASNLHGVSGFESMILGAL